MMTISELASSGGVGVETIRYYQRRGLLPDPRPQTAPSGKRGRHYGDNDRQRLSFIRAAKEAGFTLNEISRLLQLDKIADRTEVRELAQTRVAELDERIAQMKTARTALARLAHECAESSKEACPIIEAFEAQ